MDIIDVILGKSLSSTGQIDIYAARAAKAVRDANEAVATISAAADNIETLTQEVETNSETARQTISSLNAAISSLGNIDDRIQTITDTEVKKLSISKQDGNNSSYVKTDLITTYPDGTSGTTQNVVKNYTARGTNTDGSMTQKAITTELQALERKIDQGGGSGGGGTGPDLDPENSGNIVVVGEDGKPSSGSVTEESLIDLLIDADSYTVKNAVGITIDYINRTFTRTLDAVNYTPGTDFDKYSMYGGRKRCNVNATGRIVAWEGDGNYREDGTNGDVMVYQPKFYYFRNILETTDSTVGKAISKESLFLSPKKYARFKLHPRFINADGEELDYILLPAYESCLYHPDTGTYDLNDSTEVDDMRDCLVSRAGVKPISAKNIALTSVLGERLARNKGNIWHITDLGAESINQMLFMVEYGTLNAQQALGKGVSSIQTLSNYNCASITGSTSALGSASGQAMSTQNEKNGTYRDYTENGYTAITYRGVENLWGNIWRTIGGLNIVGDGQSRGGVPYICTDFNYLPDSISTNYESVGFTLPQSSSWINRFGYGDSKYDWVYLPIEAGNSANSALPVGDYVWTATDLNTCHNARIGGHWNYGDNNGLFYYAFDHAYDYVSASTSVRLMVIPEKNSTYTSNYSSWQTLMGE